jgi:hypothetical protein
MLMRYGFPGADALAALSVPLPVSEGSNSIEHFDSAQVSFARRISFIEDTSGHLTGNSFCRSCGPAALSAESPSANSTRSGVLELSKTRMKLAEAADGLTAFSATVRAL